MAITYDGHSLPLRRQPQERHSIVAAYATRQLVPLQEPYPAEVPTVGGIPGLGAIEKMQNCARSVGTGVKRRDEMVVFRVQVAEHAAEAEIQGALILEHQLFFVVPHRQQRPVESFVKIGMCEVKGQHTRVEVAPRFELMLRNGRSYLRARHFKPGQQRRPRAPVEQGTYVSLNDGIGIDVKCGLMLALLSQVFCEKYAIVTRLGQRLSAGKHSVGRLQ